MQIRYLAQPDARLGNLFLEYLSEQPLPQEVIVASAFVSLQTLLRLREPVRQLREQGSVVRFVIGVDLGGTSKEALREIASWNVPVVIFKNSSVGHTFHPKLYLLKWENKAIAIVGSSNLTEGGLFRNYETSALIEYALPEELKVYDVGRGELNRFINPAGPTTRILDNEYLTILLARDDIPTEQEARERTKETVKATGIKNHQPAAFGSEEFPPPPPMPPQVLAEILANTIDRQQTRRARAPRKGVPAVSPGELAPISFYMTLPKLQGPNIPGEARIPLPAIEMAREFWGWPDEYETKKSPRGGKERVYHDWKPNWRVSLAEGPPRAQVLPVRMYRYDNSSDFRFYARPLVRAGGDLGDIVQITRVARSDVEFECVLARKGTRTHGEWLNYCTVTTRNSVRKFGYS